MINKPLFVFISIAFLSLNAPADIIILSSGEQLEVSILEQTDSVVHIRHSILGDFEIPTVDISSIERTNVKKEVDTNESEGTETSPENNDEEIRWNQKIRLGFGYQKGQKTSSDISASYHANRTKNEHEIIFDLSYRFSESEHERTLNRFASTWSNKWFQSDSRWDIFTTLQFDWAEFQSWDQRLLGDIGVGFELLKVQEGEKEFILSGRVGSGFRKEFNSGNNEIIPEGLLGGNVDWTISSRQKVTVGTTWYPDYEDVNNYRVVTNAAWNITLNMKNDLTFSVGFHHEYNSIVDPGIKKSDLQITAGIEYSF
ncbi:MAG: DUF481 domain-containing protein [Phycisphaerae bacterium]|jgi:putative salt-induced outer membrane protein YdiY|nr:DUF481 domain-containing protein [Phycisphaerae bacterium]